MQMFAFLIEPESWKKIKKSRKKTRLSPRVTGETIDTLYEPENANVNIEKRWKIKGQTDVKQEDMGKRSTELLSGGVLDYQGIFHRAKYIHKDDPFFPLAQHFFPQVFLQVVWYQEPWANIPDVFGHYIFFHVLLHNCFSAMLIFFSLIVWNMTGNICPTSLTNKRKCGG